MQSSSLLALFLAWRNVIRHLRRSAFAIIAVATSIVAMMIATGFIEWIFWQLREATIYAQLGHIQISRKDYTTSGASDPFSYLLPAKSTEFDRIAQLPTVDSVAPRLQFSGLASVGETTMSFIGEGISPSREESLSRWVKIEKGRNLTDAEPNGAIVGEGLAKALGVGPGDKIVLMANSANSGINALEVIVSGLFSTASKKYDDSAMRINNASAQRLLRISGAHKWIVVLKDTNDTDAAIKAIKADIIGSDFEITPWYAAADFYNKTRQLFERQVLVLKLIIAIAIILAISNSFMMNVLERTSEIGTVAAMGTTQKQILMQFVYEGLIVGMIGGLIGVIGGIGLADLISRIGIPMPAPPGMSHGYVGQILISPSLVLEAFALALITSLLASAFPARRAARTNIIEALRFAR